MKHFIVHVCLILIGCSFPVESGYTKCKNKYGTAGLCVPLPKCGKLFKAFTGKNFPLENYVCGWTTEVLVCCEDLCSTSRGKIGKCQNISDCPKINNYIKTNHVSNTAMSDLNCGWKTEPMICCSNQIYMDLLESGHGTSALPNKDTCGNQGVFNKILDGSRAGLDEFPWLARLSYIDRKSKLIGYGCGGVLISNRYVLTAAHCVTNLREHSRVIHKVRLGEYNTGSTRDCVEMLGFEDCADSVQDISVEEEIRHPHGNKQNNDIAILRLAKTVQLSDFVQPICLPNRYDTYSPGDRLWISGWGKTESGAESEVKLKLSVPLVSEERCRTLYSRHGIEIGNGQICAGSEKGRDACTGDSGGPLMVQTNSGQSFAQWKVTGIVSMGMQCGLEGWPGIYTKVTEHLQWIEGNLHE